MEIDITTDQEMFEPMPPSTFEDLDRRSGITKVWNRNYRGCGVTIAVIDTGISPCAELDNVVVCEKDFSVDNDPHDCGEYSHGTSVARLIHLVAPDAKIANFKVFPRDENKQQKLGVVRQSVTEALRYCLNNPKLYPIVNLSLFLPRHSKLPCTPESPCCVCDLVNQAARDGIIVVAAAGNQGSLNDTIECPGRAEGAITVGSCWNSDEKAFYESRVLERGLFGTSFSSAYVAGGIALLLSANPALTPNEVRVALKEAAQPLPNEPLNAQGAGMVHFARALEILVGPSEDAFESKMRRLYYLTGNSNAQRPDNMYVTQALNLVLDYIDKGLIKRKQITEATKQLQKIQAYLVQGCLPDHEKRISDLLQRCRNNYAEDINPQGRVEETS
jgi:hypothetical protein